MKGPTATWLGELGRAQTPKLGASSGNFIGILTVVIVFSLLAKLAACWRSDTFSFNSGLTSIEIS